MCSLLAVPCVHERPVQALKLSAATMIREREARVAALEAQLAAEREGRGCPEGRRGRGAGSRAEVAGGAERRERSREGEDGRARPLQPADKQSNTAPGSRRPSAWK
jgi:hypothetical protein